MEKFSSLKRDQKEAIGLLQVGTFLEYFDLMIYVHMAVLLNEIFFPKTDSHTVALLSAFAFCSTYVFRPLGALLMGYIGDHIGRKATVIITTMLMAISCIVMANLPTYEQIGIAAAWVVTICRIVQGLSSMGEIVGAEIYLTEITKPPARYPTVAMVAVCSILGSMAALAIASFVMAFELNWRVAFWIGACIAVIGTAARTRLREAPEFADMKRRMQHAFEEANEGGLAKAAELLKSVSPFWKEKADRKTLITYFLIQCGWPVYFYFTYIYCGDILKSTFGYTPAQVIHHNLLVSVVQFSSFLTLGLLSYKIHPLKILRKKMLFFFPFICILPYLLSANFISPFVLLLVQFACAISGPTMNPAPAVFLVHLPILKRFTYTSLIFAISHGLMYAVTPFILLYLTMFFGYWGVFFLLLPVAIGFMWGVIHFEKLEGIYHEPPTTLPSPFKLFHYKTSH
jgi:MFS family permease